MNANDFEKAKQRIIHRISQTREKVKMLSQGNEDRIKQSKLYNPQSSPPTIILKNKHNTLGNSSKQKRVISKLSSQLIDNEYHLNALKDFPFGKQRAKMVNLISNCMNPKQDQLNKIILNKFRMQAIQYRNNKKKLSSQRNNLYMSQSMMPTSNYQPELNLNQQITNQSLVSQPNQISTQKFTNVFSPIANLGNKMTVRHNSIAYQYNTPLSRYKSIAVDTQFLEKIKQKQEKKANVRQLKYLQKIKQQKRINKIETMIHQVNQKIRKNTQLINQTIVQDKKIYPRKSSKNKKTKQKYQQVFEPKQEKIEDLQKQLDGFPKVQYTANTKKHKATQLDTKSPSQIKNHLILLRNITKNQISNDLQS